MAHEFFGCAQVAKHRKQTLAAAAGAQAESTFETTAQKLCKAQTRHATQKPGADHDARPAPQFG